MHRTIARAVCALAFIAGDLLAEPVDRYPAPLEVKEPIVAWPKDVTYGHLECISGGSKVECDKAVSQGGSTDIRYLLLGMGRMFDSLHKKTGGK